ncbi:DUF4252 domain-containing protein [Salegentibacter sp. Hel_I_6]|uniref:DUF4252 domain-containing protein n=1 Tax=Salegentibacter sp. Hel_I_6 TaxID=1250278 RepID=UPI000567D874|nr:DUF4252 domain-containing protein [Salegentibacter sp. Hel_I_6]
MKKIIIVFIIGLLPVITQAQSFAKYENMRDVDAMVMTSKMFKMLAKVDLSDDNPEAKEYLELIENLDEIKMFTSTKASVRSEMQKDVETYLNSNSLDQLMRVKEEGKNIRFYSKSGKSDNYVSELFMFMEGEKEGEPISVILSITGQIDLSHLSRLTSDLKIPGAEELKNVEKKS